MKYTFDEQQRQVLLYALAKLTKAHPEMLPWIEQCAEILDDPEHPPYPGFRDTI